MKFIFKANALAESALLRCDCFLFYSLFHSKFHIIMKTSSAFSTDQRSKTKKNETNKKNEIACVTTCIRVYQSNRFLAIPFKNEKNYFYKNEYESTERTANVSTCDL